MANGTRKSKKRSKKAGMGPGALVHIGEIKTQQTKLTLIDYDTDTMVERELDDFAEIQNWQKTGRVLWLNVYGLQNSAAMRSIGEHFGLHPLVLEDILNTDQRPKADDYNDYLFLVSHVFEYDANKRVLVSDQVSIVLGRDFVLTFQERPTGTFEPLRQRLRAERSPIRSRSADYLAYCILDGIVDREFVLIEQMGDEAERLEESVLDATPRTKTLQAIHRLKSNVLELRRTVWPLREVLHIVQRNTSGLFAGETILYLRDVYDHAVHVAESLEGLRDLLSGILDVYLSTVSNRVNQEVRMLTVIATVFMPATLVAGIFGMNFKSMPWLDAPDGFSFALGLMGGVGSIMLLTFWRRKLF